MGLELHMFMMPGRIPTKKWEEAYEETLALLDSYPFLDILWHKVGDQYMIYCEHSRERSIREHGEAGWRRPMGI